MAQEKTTNVDIPLIESGEQNGDVTYNEGQWINDLHNQAIITAVLVAQPAGINGNAYIVGPSATGADWVGHDDEIAHYWNDVWHFYPPKNGWVFYNTDDEHNYSYDGAVWNKGPLYLSFGGAANVNPALPQVMPAATIVTLDAFEAVAFENKLTVTLTPSGAANNVLLTPATNYDGWFICKLNVYAFTLTNNEVDFTFYVNDGVANLSMGTYNSYKKRLSCSPELIVKLLPGNSAQLMVMSNLVDTLTFQTCYVSANRIKAG